MTPEHAIARLDEFAKRRGPAGVARALRLFGVRGEQGEPRTCAVSVYLRMRCPTHDFFVPVCGTIEHRSAGAPAPPIGAEFGELAKVSPQLDEFAARFDLGLFPDLILPDPA